VIDMIGRRRLTPAAASLGLVALLLPACDNARGAVRGSGTLTSEERSVSGFDAVALDGSGSLIIDVGGAESLTIEAEDNILPLLTSNVTGSTLKLSSSKPISPTKPITYTLGASAMEGVSISGSGDVVAPNLACGTFEAELSGSGTFDVGGTCDGLDLSIAGDGDFDGEDLAVATASVSIDGSGDAIVKASDELNVTINGSGDVEYLGDPTTEIDISGSGDVHRR
jgi:Putative auto-transporter adhesin, head GIN domain